MAVFNNMVITAKGEDLYNKVQAGIPLNFTKMKIGSGQLAESDNPETFTVLKDYKFDVSISSITQNTQLQVAIISGTINNTTITEGQYICELGLFAEDPDEGEILYGYTNAGTLGDYIAPNNKGAFAWNYQVNAAVGNAAEVTATVSSTTFDYAVASSSTTFAIISGTNQKEINQSIDTTFGLIKDTVNFEAGSFTATEDNTASFTITDVPYNPETDHVELFYLGNQRLALIDNYTMTGARIDLVDWALKSGEKITYNIWKFVNHVPIMADGANLQDNSVALRSLTEDVQENINQVPALTSQMAEQVIQIDNLDANKAEKEDLNITNTSVSLKADKNYVDSQLQTLSLTYKESYNTISDLQAAYPTGDTYNHCVLSDGMIYTYVNSTWTSTGIQGNGMGIANNSVTENKLSFIPVKGVASKNLFNIATATDNTYLYTDTGTTATNSNYRTSDYIAVLSNTQYSIMTCVAVCFYTSSKVFISSVSNSPKNVTTPANCAYIRFFYWMNSPKNQVELGNQTTAYEPFGNVLSPDYITVKMKDSLNNIDVIYPSQGKNLFNRMTKISGYLYLDTGIIATSTDYSTSDYIAVLSNTQYSTLRIIAVCFYDSNKTFISSVSNSPKNVTTPANCAYMRFYTWAGWIDKIQIEAGTSTAYEPYGSYLNRTLIPTGFVKSSNNVIVVAKTGGDYSTIMDAVNRAGDSYDNPITILIMPGIYKESVDLRSNRYISLVGINKYTCIIQNDTGNYFTPPLNLGGNAYVANLKITATHDNPTSQDGIAYGTTGYIPAYGIHMDENGEGVNELFNCIVISKQSAAIGMGLHNNQTNIINACELYTQDSDAPRGMGTLYAHNQQFNGATNQKLYVKNSKFINDTGVVLRLEDANHYRSGGDGDARDTVFGFYNNIMWSKVYGKTNIVSKDAPLADGYLTGYISLSQDSFGNNISEINA